MPIKRMLLIAIIAVFLFLTAGAVLFVYNTNRRYNINGGFSAVPLNFNPDDSSSSYSWNGAVVIVYGGFVKGIQKNDDKSESLLIRALSPLPSVQCIPAGCRSLSILIENVNPTYYTAHIPAGLRPERKRQLYRWNSTPGWKEIYGRRRGKIFMSSHTYRRLIRAAVRRKT